MQNYIFREFHGNQQKLTVVAVKVSLHGPVRVRNLGVWVSASFCDVVIYFCAHPNFDLCIKFQRFFRCATIFS